MFRLLLLALLAAVMACGHGDAPREVTAAAPPEIVSAHTSGMVSRRDAIRVRFVAEAVPEDVIGKVVDSSPFSFDPKLRGRTTWTSRQEVAFQPESELEPGRTYRAVFDLPGVVPAPFAFTFAAPVQSWRSTSVGLESASEDGTTQRFRGVIELADVADAAQVEKMLTVAHEDDSLTVTWTHEDGSFEHAFHVDGIRRRERGTSLALNVDGGPVGAGEDRVETVPVPGLNQFVVNAATAQIDGDRRIEVRFSDPLDPKQDLRGLVRVLGRDDLRLERDGSVLRIYASGAWNGSEEVQIEGVRNARGFALLDPFTVNVSFEPIKPQVRFVGSSVILPTSAELTVPLEVVNVRAIEVEATRVYASNVPQFLQVNDLGGDEQLTRVGTVVWKDRMNVDTSGDKANRWVRVGLDLAALVKEHPTGLYRLKVTFRRGDIAWECREPAWEEGDARPAQPWDGSTGDRSFWDLWEGADEEDGWGWDWDSREDPCRKAYYQDWGWNRHGQSASRNVVVSDVGLLARQGAGGTVHVVVTDLRTGAPKAAAEVQLLDYQLQSLATGRTGTNGLVRLESPDEHPFVAMARADGQTGWLRLDRGQALSVSHFDTGGAEVSRGMKGFVYGERGVWRPGDDMFLTFVLFDAEDRVPDEHPVEFQLRNPRGQTVDTQVVARGTDGFYAIRTRTSGDAPTGRYQAIVRVGGAVFQRQLRVEAVIPNRLKIDLPLPEKGVRRPDLGLATTLSSRWLHGAVARNLEADIQVAYQARQTTFAKYADYTFDDPEAKLDAEPAELWKGELDDKGNATVSASLAPPDAAGMLTAVLRTRVHEPGGAASVDEASVLVSPYGRYVGIALPKGDKARGMLLTDTPHTVRVVAVDADGRPTGTGKVRLAVHKLRWRWWWEQGADQELAEYAGSDSHAPVASGEIELKNGVGTWDFQVHYPDWGRYLVTATDDVAGGHATGKVVYIDWPGWAGRAQKDQPGGATVLSLTADKEKAEVGQNVTLSFPMPRGARALVSLETGAGVVLTDWVEPDPASETGRYTFAATPAMTPTIYAHVTVIQPHRTLANDAPLRLYGVVPVGVYDAATRLAPKLATAAVFKPNNAALVSVSEASGRPMTYTLAVVDEGLLGLTRHATPNPWDTFYAREALGVRTWDLFDMVAGAYGGTIETMLAIGGDGEAESNKRPKAQRFKPVVWYGGPYQLAAGATDRREVPIPQYVGEVRVMVVAGRGGAFGSAEASVPVRTPLMALATLPRVLGPGEEVALPVSIFAMDAKVKDVKVDVSATGPATVASPASRSVRFSDPGEKLAKFTLRVGDTLGVAKVTVTASGGGEKVTQTLEVDVRHPGAPVTRAVAATIAAGQTWTADVALPGLAGTNALSLEVSRMPPLDLGSRLDDLLRYPHGCVEQTTSSALPQVALRSVMDLTPGESQAVTRHVTAAIDRLRSFQASDGGFGYWPGEPSHEWGSSYAGQFLVEAERAGFAVPAGMKAAWLRYQRQQAGTWRNDVPRDDLDQAYRLYTMALAGNPDIGAMNRLKESRLSDPARWRLALAWLLAGQGAAAREMVARAGTHVSVDRELSHTFGSPLRDRAMILEALVLLGRTDAAVEAAKEVSAALASTHYLSTQETAYALVAMSRFGADSTAGETAFTWNFAGSPVAKIASPRALVRVPIAVGAGTSGKASVTNTSPGTLFVTAIGRGLPAPGTETDEAQGLTLAVEYVSMSDLPLDPARIEQGSSFVARITVTNTGSRPLDELVLSQVIPSGWEVGGLAPGRGDGFDYRDVRDDRVYTYFDLEAGEELALSVPLNASYLGHFYLPPISVEAMYDASVRARVAGRWADVVELPVD